MLDIKCKPIAFHSTYTVYGRQSTDPMKRMTDNMSRCNDQFLEISLCAGHR